MKNSIINRIKGIFKPKNIPSKWDNAFKGEVPPNTFLEEATGSHLGFVESLKCIEITNNKNLQRIENMRIGAAIQSEAWRLFTEYRNADDLQLSDGRVVKNYLFLINPTAIGTVTVYDEETVQYKDINREIIKKFQEYKNEEIW